jgi:hypothetical protein
MNADERRPGNAGTLPVFPLDFGRHGAYAVVLSRIARAVAVGLPHHVTQRGSNRADVFFADRDREYYLRAPVRYCGEFRLEVSSAQHHALGTPDLVTGASQWPTQAEREQYREYSNSDEQESERIRIRTSTQTGRPLGSLTFIKELGLKLGRTLHPQKARRRKTS